MRRENYSVWHIEVDLWKGRANLITLKFESRNKWMRVKNISEEDGVTRHSKPQQALELRQQRLVTTEPALICSAFILSNTQHCFECSSLFLRPFGFPRACCLATWSLSPPPPTSKHRHHVTRLWLTWNPHHHPSASMSDSQQKWCSRHTNDAQMFLNHLRSTHRN